MIEAMRRFWSKLAPRDRRAILLGAAGLAVMLVVWLAAGAAGRWLDAREHCRTIAEDLPPLQHKAERQIQQRSAALARYGPGLARPLEDVQTARIGFVEAVSGVLKSAGMACQTGQPQPVKPIKELPGVCAVPYQIKATCQGPQLANCLAAMKRAERLIIVEQLTVAGNERSPNQLEVTLVLSTLARRTETTP